jgi:hypothetical protein
MLPGELNDTSSAGAVEARETLHFILYVKLEFLEADFFDQVFGTEVGRLGEFLKLRIILPVLFGQTLILGVCSENYVPRAPLRCGHASSYGWSVNIT